jgi:hypothetical protein
MTAQYRYIGPLESNRDRSCQIDEETALWAARMCVGEGGKNCSEEKASAMLWALMNRWFLHPGRRHWPTFLYLMRRFSQPINPRWQKGGDLARRYRNKPAGSPARLRRRARICALKWGDDEISATVSGVITDFYLGLLRPPDELQMLDHPRISNWASYPGLRERYPHGIDFRGDWFFEDVNLGPGVVVVDHWR